MKKTIKFLAFVICPILFSVSCEKETGIVDYEESPVNTSRVITLEFPSNPESKVSFAEDGKTAWEAGDEILIHGQKMGHSGDDYYSRVITLSAGDISADGKTATFTMESIVADKSWGRTGYAATLFAAYPASAVKSVSDGTSWYYSTGFDTNNILLLGGCNDTNVNDGNTFTFTHLSGVLSFVVSGDFDSYVFSGNSGSEVLGYEVFAVRVDQQSSFGDKTVIPYSGGGGGIGSSGAKNSLTGSLVADGSTVNHIYFPGGVNLSSGFTIKFLKGGVEQKRISTNTGKNIAMGKYLKLGDVTSHLFTYVAPASHDASHPAITGATDLGTSGTANCYIVDGSVASNAGKVFKFKAVKGNSSTSVGTIDSVTILWETYNDANEVTANSVIKDADFDFQDGDDYSWITFEMPATLHAGNAVIAAKDVSDNILWSWHIWVPATTISEGTYGVSTPNMLDRNLGSLKAATWGTDDVQTMGLLYQWGRKDPFLNKKNHASSSNDYSQHALTSGSSTMETKQMASIEESIQNPTVFAGQSADKTSWLAIDDTTLWGDSKTIYDPCPTGYKVPAKSDCVLFTANMTDTSVYTGFEMNTTTCQVAVGMSGNVTVFPTGYLYYNGRYDEPHNKMVLWSSSFADTYRATCLYFKLSDGSYSQYKRSIASGGSVRCVAE